MSVPVAWSVGPGWSSNGSPPRVDAGVGGRVGGGGGGLRRTELYLYL